MVNYTQTTYDTPAALKVAVDVIANTVTILVVPFTEDGNQKFLLIT